MSKGVKIFAGLGGLVILGLVGFLVFASGSPGPSTQHSQRGIPSGH